MWLKIYEVDIKYNLEARILSVFFLFCFFQSRVLLMFTAVYLITYMYLYG